MKTERTIKFTLDTYDLRAVSSTLDIVSSIFETMNPTDIIVVNGNDYSYDDIDDVRVFLRDLWENDSRACGSACEIIS